MEKDKIFKFEYSRAHSQFNKLKKQRFSPRRRTYCVDALVLITTSMYYSNWHLRNWQSNKESFMQLTMGTKELCFSRSSTYRSSWWIKIPLVYSNNPAAESCLLSLFKFHTCTRMLLPIRKSILLLQVEPQLQTHLPELQFYGFQECVFRLSIKRSHWLQQ